jgi:RNA polymerase sigma-70 factor (ECF subfamily)
VSTRHQHADDVGLVRATRSGDSEAFAELVERHRRRVFAVVFHAVGDREMADDLTQETFVRAYTHIDAYSPAAAKFSTWLATIATRLAIDAKRRARPTESLEHLQEERGFDPASEARADTSVRQDAVSSEVHRALQRLPERQRIAVTLKHIEDLPFTEVARAMGCSVNSAKVHAHRGRRLMARMLGHLREEDAP